MIMCTTTRERNSTHEEWVYEGTGNYIKLIPIEGGDGVQSKTGHATGNRGELYILRGDPSNPVEV